MNDLLLEPIEVMKTVLPVVHIEPPETVAVELQTEINRSLGNSGRQMIKVLGCKGHLLLGDGQDIYLPIEGLKKDNRKEQSV